MERFYNALYEDGLFEKVWCSPEENEVFSEMEEAKLPQNVFRDKIVKDKATKFVHYRYVEVENSEKALKYADLYYKRKISKGIWYLVWLSAGALILSVILAFLV